MLSFSSVLKCCFFLFLTSVAFLDSRAQAPDSVNYQAVARDDQGKVLANEQIDVRMKVLSGSNAGTLVYEEEHNNVSTNQFGLFTLYIGGGAQTGGSAASFDSIDWGNAPHHIEVAVDAGSGYESLGSRKFVSVPYALYAKEAGTGGGGGSDTTDLQTAYSRGNTISLDSSSTPVSISSGGKPHLHVDSSALRVGHTNPLPNTQLDVRYDAAPTPGPAIMGSSAPLVLPNTTFQGQVFQTNNGGVLGVGVGTQKAIGVTGYSIHEPSAPWASTQDSAYGVIGIAEDRVGKTIAGVSAIARAYSNTAQRSVGIYALVDDQTTTDYQSDPFLAGGVFDANIDGDHTSLDTTFGVVGLGGFGGDHSIGVYGFARGDTGSASQTTYGVVGQAGVSPDTNVGVLGQGNFALGAGKSLAAWFRSGKTLIQDTLQIDYGNPNAGEFLKAVDAQGNAVWDTVPAGGTPIALQDAYNNGDSIALNSGGSFEVSNNGSTYQYLFASDGNNSLSVGHQQPIGSFGGSPVSLHVANGGPNPGQVLISAGDNSNSFDAVLGFSENIGGVFAGAEIRWDAGYNKLILGRDVGGGAPMLAVQGGPGATHGVLIGGTYSGGLTNPPENGLLVEDTVGIGTTSPAHKHHIEGRTYSSNSFLTEDTAEYRYTGYKHRVKGFGGYEFRPTSSTTTPNNNYLSANGNAYFSSTVTLDAEVSAPLHLPDDAVVDTVIYHLFDNVSTDTIDVRLERIPYGPSTTPSTVTGSKALSNDASGHTLVRPLTNPLVIDNSQYFYRLRAIFSSGQGTSLRLMNVEVRYRVKKAD